MLHQRNIWAWKRWFVERALWGQFCMIGLTHKYTAKKPNYGFDIQVLNIAPAVKSQLKVEKRFYMSKKGKEIERSFCLTWINSLPLAFPRDPSSMSGAWQKDIESKEIRWSKTNRGLKHSIENIRLHRSRRFWKEENEMWELKEEQWQSSGTNMECLKVATLHRSSFTAKPIFELKYSSLDTSWNKLETEVSTPQIFKNSNPLIGMPPLLSWH